MPLFHLTAWRITVTCETGFRQNSISIKAWPTNRATLELLQLDLFETVWQTARLRLSGSQVISYLHSHPAAHPCCTPWLDASKVTR